MSYKKATHLLSPELLTQIQEYVDGETIYIPRRTGSKKRWGTGTTIRQELRVRNERIYGEYLAGAGTETLAQRYYLSVKSIQRIIAQMKKEPRK